MFDSGAPTADVDYDLDESHAALAELARRASRWKPSDSLFDKQSAFVRDRSRFKTALCSRRAGKTLGCAHYLLSVCLEKRDALCLYIALTRASAKRLLWRELKKLNAKHRLGLDFNATELTVEFPNGSQLLLTGAQEEADIEKWRGSAYDLVVIDEAGSFAEHLSTLVEQVIEPALLDKKGTLVLVGTPNARCAGWFYEITTGKRSGWSRHEWTVLDNPHLTDVAAELEAIKLRRGWTEQTPAFLREMRGRWVRSDDALVYHYDLTVNDFEELPEGHVWNFVIGGDVGYRDRAAWTVLAWAESCPAAYIVHSEAHPGLIPAALAAVWQRLLVDYPGAQCVMDCGALGLSIAEEFRTRYGLPIVAADKREKLAGIELLNGDLKAKRLFARAGTPLTEEWAQLQFDAKVSTRDPNARKEDPHLPNDAADSALYAYRYSRHYWHTDPPAAEKPGSQAWASKNMAPKPPGDAWGGLSSNDSFDDRGWSDGQLRRGQQPGSAAQPARVPAQRARRRCAAAGTDQPGGLAQGRARRAASAGARRHHARRPVRAGRRPAQRQHRADAAR